MPYTEETVSSRDGLHLYLRRSEATAACAEVILVHGFCEHSGRYCALTEHMVRRGFNVTAYDQRGHGLSEGLPGHVDRFDDYVDDLRRVVASVKARGDSRPIFVIAHSLGGLIALAYLSSKPAVAGAAISAPLLGVAVKVPAHKTLIGRLGARLAPRLRMKNEIDPAHLSRDPRVGEAYAADPLVGKLVSTRWFAEVLGAMERTRAALDRVWAPVLVMHGSEDRLASLEATVACFERIGASDKELAVYDGFYHELFNEPEKEEIFDRVASWIGARIEPASNRAIKELIRGA
jgi:alpha-beta hydrolase superfamily lysophospholipase